MLKDIHVQCGRHICSGAYVNNLECMYIPVFMVTFLTTVSFHMR